MNQKEKRSIVVEQACKRVDHFISQQTRLSRAKARALCEAGEVRINGKRCRPGASLFVGDRVEFEEVEQIRLFPEQVGEELQITKGVKLLFEDDWLLIIDKPRQIHSVRQRVEDPATLADVVAQYLPQAQSSGRNPLEAGLVQRLDFFTSGAVMIAKISSVWEQMHQALIRGQVKKRYHALVDGVPKWQNKVLEIGLLPDFSGKKVETSEEIEPVKTIFKVVQTEKKYGEATLLEATSFHTVRHQIRAHAAFLGFPLVGDSLYGSRRSLAEFVEGVPQGFYLHAAGIEFVHPITGEDVVVESKGVI